MEITIELQGSSFCPRPKHYAYAEKLLSDYMDLYESNSRDLEEFSFFLECKLNEYFDVDSLSLSLKSGEK